jgi:hypothetical protein
VRCEKSVGCVCTDLSLLWPGNFCPVLLPLWRGRTCVCSQLSIVHHGAFPVCAPKMATRVFSSKWTDKGHAKGSSACSDGCLLTYQPEWKYSLGERLRGSEWPVRQRVFCLPCQGLVSDYFRTWWLLPHTTRTQPPLQRTLHASGHPKHVFLQTQLLRTAHSTPPHTISD